MFLFVKIESWNTQQLFHLGFVKPCKISAHSDKHSDNILLWGIQVVQMSWNFVRFHEMINQRDAENFRFLSWVLTNKKVLFLKYIKCTMYHGKFFFQPTDGPWCPNFPNPWLCSALLQLHEIIHLKTKLLEPTPIFYIGCTVEWFLFG